jgi:hypothetical protein
VGKSSPASEIFGILKGLIGAQANDAGWPQFNGNVTNPIFRKECWAYNETYFGPVWNEMACRVLKKKLLVGKVPNMVGSIGGDLMELWQTLDVSFDRPEKFIPEAM